MSECINYGCPYWKNKKECSAAEGCVGFVPEEVTLPPQTCQNCDFEEYCDHCPEGVCGSWRPDLDYKRLMEKLSSSEIPNRRTCK